MRMKQAAGGTLKQKDAFRTNTSNVQCRRERADERKVLFRSGAISGASDGGVRYFGGERTCRIVSNQAT